MANQEKVVARLIELQEENERQLILLERCYTVLGNMARENTGWRAFFRRWPISHEPLRSDAKNLMPLLVTALFDEAADA